VEIRIKKLTPRRSEYGITQFIAGELPSASTLIVVLGQNADSIGKHVLTEFSFPRDIDWPGMKRHAILAITNIHDKTLQKIPLLPLLLLPVTFDFLVHVFVHGAGPADAGAVLGHRGQDVACLVELEGEGACGSVKGVKRGGEGYTDCHARRRLTYNIQHTHLISPLLRGLEVGVVRNVHCDDSHRADEGHAQAN